MSGAAFSRRSAVALAVAGGLSLVAAGVLGVFGDVLSDPLTTGPDAWSRSALGHRVLLELLRGEGHPVQISRHATARKAHDGAVVALLEPDLLQGDDAREAALEAIAGSASRLVVALPKRTGTADPQHPRWLGEHQLLSGGRAERVLSLLGLDGEVIRPAHVGAWRGVLPAPDLDQPQLIRGARLRPLLETDEGVLVGEAELLGGDEDDGEATCHEDEGPCPADTAEGGAPAEDGDAAATTASEADAEPEAPAASFPPDDPFPSCDPEAPDDCEGIPRVLVVADPDLLAHHGIGRGRNAALAVAVMERLARPGEPVVVDETLHGHESQPSLAAELLGFPLVLTTLQALGAALLLCGAALARFGRPWAARQGLAPGKAFLVDNTAELLRAGGHVADAAEAYLRAAREEVLARLHPPPGEAPAAWLRRVEAARGRAGALDALEARVARLRTRRRGVEAEAVRAARDIHRWREELTDGAE